MTLVAPQISGHRHVRLISDAGGYGDVHLYEETALGNRKVAIKVIRDHDLDSAALRQFLAEANTMAALEHPNIVRVYGSGSTADGRPYISMQYCAGDSLERRVLRERLSVAEVLRTGVGIGSAIETAHRAGLLHRDIKPANILKTPWGAPGLTDFGVAHQIASDEVNDDVGVSVPWSPPEMLYTSTNGSPASDVYSLAATLWHLLVGRPPFEVPGGDNGTLATMSRIRDLTPPTTGRPDVPESLERVLRQALAKRPEQRPQTMAEFIRNLQTIEAEQHLQVSESVVVDFHDDIDHVHEVPGHLRPGPPPPPGAPAAAGPERGTVMRPRTSGTMPTPPAPGIRDDSLGAARTQLRPAAAGNQLPSQAPSSAANPSPLTESGTLLRPRVTTVEVPPGPDPEASPRTKGMLVGGGLLLLVVAAIVGFVLLSRGGESTPTTGSSALSTTNAAAEDAIPPGPVTIKATRAGDQVTFTWDYSAKQEDDEYRWQVVGGAEGTSTDPTTTVAAVSADPVCLQVIVVRIDGSSATKDWSKQGCG
jgi:serine/threonine protein kinase